MPHFDPADGYAGVLDFLRDRLQRGDACLASGNARGAIVHYDSALASFLDHRHDPALRDVYRALWANKSTAHQQLREFAKSQEAAIVATALGHAA